MSSSPLRLSSKGRPRNTQTQSAEEFSISFRDEKITERQRQRRAYSSSSFLHSEGSGGFPKEMRAWRSAWGHAAAFVPVHAAEAWAEAGRRRAAGQVSGEGAPANGHTRSSHLPSRGSVDVSIIVSISRPHTEILEPRPAVRTIPSKCMCTQDERRRTHSGSSV